MVIRVHFYPRGLILLNSFSTHSIKQDKNQYTHTDFKTRTRSTSNAQRNCERAHAKSVRRFPEHGRIFREQERLPGKETYFGDGTLLGL